MPWVLKPWYAPTGYLVCSWRVVHWRCYVYPAADSHGCSQQIVTSLSLDEFSDSIVLLGSSNTEQAEACPFYICVPKIDAYFSGVGDLLAALLLYHTSENPNNLDKATELAVASLQKVLQCTAQAAGAARNSQERSADVMKARELRLVQCQSDILNPVVEYRSIPAKS